MGSGDASFKLGVIFLNRLIARGQRNGLETEVKIIEGNTFIDGDVNDSYDAALHEQRPIGGTYYAEPDSMLNIYNNLKYFFFDRQAEVQVTGTLEPIPYEDGLIY